MTTTRGSGSRRHRGGDQCEVRVSLGPDPVSGRSAVHSVTVRGDLVEAQRQRELLATQAEAIRASHGLALKTLADLLGVWLRAEHDWKPSTWQNYRIAAARIARDPLAQRAPSRLSPPVMTAAVASWRLAGVPRSTIALHVRTLRAVLGWAYAQRLIACQPLDGMRGLAQPEPRRDVPVPVVVALLAAAALEVERARQQPAGTAASRAVHQAEQVRLLLRLAADTGARRGELGALRLNDLDGRRLHIERGVSAEVVTSTKTGRSRTLTVGGETARLWQDSVQVWRDGTPEAASFGPWLFSRRLDHTSRMPWSWPSCSAPSSAGTPTARSRSTACATRSPPPGRRGSPVAGPATTGSQGRLHHAAPVLPRPAAARPGRCRPTRGPPQPARLKAGRGARSRSLSGQGPPLWSP